MAHDGLAALTLGYASSQAVVSKGLCLLTLGYVCEVSEPVEPVEPSEPSAAPSAVYSGGAPSTKYPLLRPVDPAFVAEEIGKVILEMDQDTEEQRNALAKLVALRIALVFGDGGKEAEVAAALALLAVSSKKTED